MDQRLDRRVGVVAGPANPLLADREQMPLEEVCAAVTDEVEIRLEYEAAYEWLAFVPRRNSDAGALTKYFGRSADGEYKYRGIECRQRSTCEFVADA
jgi:DNA polymerase I